MGTARKIRKKFERPSHPWQRSRLEKEAKIRETYGIRRKSEIWKMNTILKNFKKQAKNLIVMTGKQAEIEKKQLVTRVNSLGLVGNDATMDDILSLTLENLLDRRLQSKIKAIGLARTPKQARQMIVHGHINVNDNVIDSPSYLVRVGDKISYTKSSTFNNPEHAERIKFVNPVKEAKKKGFSSGRKRDYQRRGPERNIRRDSKEANRPKGSLRKRG